MNYKFEPLNMKEHRKCPVCGKLMIRRISTTVDNERMWYWWCNCGNAEGGDIVKGVSEISWAKKEWERVNNIEKGVNK